MAIFPVPSVVSICSLLIMSIQDIKRKEISLWLILVYVLSGIIASIFLYSMMDVVFSLIPGALMLFLAFVSEEKIGYADGLISIGLGIWMGAEFSVIVIILSFGCVGAYSIVFILIEMIKKKGINVQKQLPFIPFLLGGLVMSIGYVYSM